MPIVKICGLTDEGDCKNVAGLRPDYAGLVLAESPRQVSLEKALELRKFLVGVKKVALFVNEEPERVEEVAREIGANAVQFHGDPEKETPEYCSRFMKHWYVWKAMNERNIDKIPDYASAVDAIVFDAFVEGERGGTGKVCDWGQASMVRELAGDLGIHMILAGGLTPENVAEAVRRVNPWGVDVSSGVEGEVKGRKSYEKMRDFIGAAKIVA